MIDRASALSNLVAGDIFHAKCPNGASLICLVETVTATTIQARTVTHQIHLEFDRTTGIALFGDDRVPCTIDSIAPLPIHIHDVMVAIDRKERLERNPEKHKLSREEKQALLFVSYYYPSNPL
jgi:hypothetical protein